MKKDKTLFERYAKSLIELVLDSAGQDQVLDELSHREPKLKKIGRVRFFEEYIPAKLVLGCRYWGVCCEAHRIEDQSVRNIFFKEVMKRFESPNSLAVATRFSESLYASNKDSEDPPALTVMTHLFEKLDISRAAGPAATDGISPAFIFMMEVSDALKSVFENGFDDFIYADDDFRVS